MPYVEDEKGNHIIDGNGNKMTYTVSYSNFKVPPYIHREKLHIDDDGHINTENRHSADKGWSRFESCSIERSTRVY